MIQLSTLTLLLAAGLSGTAWANTPTAEPSQPSQSVVELMSSMLQMELAHTWQPKDQGKLYYVWDRVGKPLGKERFFI
jgi:hypothetical protein